MNITLDITPEVQAELARQAATTGRGLEFHAASLLEEALHLSPPTHDSGHQRKVPFGRRLVDAFAEARRQGLFEDGELEFSRDRSPGRQVDLS
jgi:hypothetical protein